MVSANFLNRGTESRLWQGTQRHFYTAYTIKNLLLLPFVILIIVESVLHRRWARGYYYDDASFWIRNSLPMICDAALTLVTAWCIATQRWHPIAALVTSILWIGPWVTGMTWNIFGPAGMEVGFPIKDTWNSMCWVEAAFQGVFIILYLIMMGFAANAVHKWRKVKWTENVDVELSAGKVSKRLSQQSSWDDASAKI